MAPAVLNRGTPGACGSAHAASSSLVIISPVAAVPILLVAVMDITVMVVAILVIFPAFSPESGFLGVMVPG